MTATRPPLGWNMRLMQLGREVGHDIRGGVALAAPLIRRLGADEHHAGVGGAAAES